MFELILLECQVSWLCRDKEHVYGKLAPQAVNSTLLAEDGEANFTTKDKKHPSDFALWKAAKPGEPSWPSPKCAQDGAGTGRPGQASSLHILLSLSKMGFPDHRRLSEVGFPERP